MKRVITTVESARPFRMYDARSRCAIPSLALIPYLFGLVFSTREGNVISNVFFITGAEYYERNRRDIRSAVKILGLVNVRYSEKARK